MQRPWWLVLVLGGLIAAGPPNEEDLEGNSLRLGRWRDDKEHYKRLQNDLRAFYQLSREDQARLRRIDRELHEKDSTTLVHLWNVLDRYRAWLEQLPEDQRKQVLALKNPDERIRLIRDIRQQQWIDRQPVKFRTKLMELPRKERAERVSIMQRAERAQKQEWLRAAINAPRLGVNAQPEKLNESPIDFGRNKLNAEKAKWVPSKHKFTDHKSDRGKRPSSARDKRRERSDDN